MTTTVSKKNCSTKLRRVRVPGRQIELALPATSANLGPAFDAAALALNLFLRVRASSAKQFSIRATGRNTDICERVENNLILTTYRDVLQAEKKPILPLMLHIENEIPIGKGCGSSAAARLAGIALAVHYGKLPWIDDRIVGEASRREHHADNAAACWLGGLAIARMANGRDTQTANFVPKGKWRLLLAIPEESLATDKARQVLPTQYSRADAVSNIQNSMLMLAAFLQGSRLSPEMLEDKIHQPYRAALCPLLPALQKLSPSVGIQGVALSGAGPSVLIFVDSKVVLSGVERRIREHLRSQKLTAELLSTTISKRGGNISFRRQV